MSTTAIGASSVNPIAEQLLGRARLELDSADLASEPEERFLHAHMAAIRGASALLSLGVVAPRRRGRLRSVWEQLTGVGHEWEPWAARFEASARVRAAIESGRLSGLDPAVADEAVQVADVFVARVAAATHEAQSAQARAMAS